MGADHSPPTACSLDGQAVQAADLTAKLARKMAHWAELPPRFQAKPLKIIASIDTAGQGKRCLR